MFKKSPSKKKKKSRMVVIETPPSNLGEYLLTFQDNKDRVSLWGKEWVGCQQPFMLRGILASVAPSCYTDPYLCTCSSCICLHVAPTGTPDSRGAAVIITLMRLLSESFCCSLSSHQPKLMRCEEPTQQLSLHCCLRTA